MSAIKIESANRNFNEPEKQGFDMLIRSDQIAQNKKN